MSKYVPVGENLVRHQSGTIYLRAKVAGKPVRISLKTSDLRIAKIKRDDRLASLRKGAKKEVGASKVKSLNDAVALLEKQTVSQPHLKKRTADYYKEICKILRETLPLDLPARSWTALEAARWWKATADKYSAQRANNVLALAKRMADMLCESGILAFDPTEKLKRVRIEARNGNIPSRVTIEAIIADIRGQKKANSEQAANFVAFLAFGGCRVAQARAVKWEDIQDDWITFAGGVEGTKGAGMRRLPINPRLRTVLDAMRPAEPCGQVFSMVSPREALTNSCVRLKIPHIRVHDLRHFFASYAIESGIDVPTVARWLGHKDGGVLAMRTYGHLRDDHSLASAAKFG